MAQHSSWQLVSTASMLLLGLLSLRSAFSAKHNATSHLNTTLDLRQLPDIDTLWTSYDYSYISQSIDEAHNLSSMKLSISDFQSPGLG